MPNRPRPCLPPRCRRVLAASWIAILLTLICPGRSRAADPAPSPALVLHQQLVEGYLSDGPDPEDLNAVFAWFFRRLPDDVTVYPSENYYYFQMTVAGRQLWGNLRLAAGAREKGQVSFAYAEFPEFPGTSTNRLVRARFMGKEDGLAVQSTAPLLWELSFREKTVRFHLHALRQEPPKKFNLAPGEEFVMRTFDESGCQFFLLFNGTRNHFFWVLNEEELVPDRFEPVGPDLVLGRRTGFAFWVDKARSNRRVLVAVRRASVVRNDYFDGPFDQLADNDADVTKVASFIERAYKMTRGKIDKYGYWLNRTDGQRVGLASYGTYEKPEDLLEFVRKGREAPDFLEYIGRAQDGKRGTNAPAVKK